MKMKNFLSLMLIAVLAFTIASAGQKTKKATETKKEMKSCCMDAKATKASNEKSATGAMNAKHEHGKGMECCADDKDCKEKMTKMSSNDTKSSAHATNAKHEMGKGMDCCADEKECKEKDAKMGSMHGKDCCKDMTKAEDTKTDTKSENAAPKE